MLSALGEISCSFEDYWFSPLSSLSVESIIMHGEYEMNQTVVFGILE